MTRKLKTLGLAFVAVLALTAVSASAASAANYTAATYPTTGTATSPIGNDVFTTEAGKVECSSHFSGTLTKAANDLTVLADYNNCKAFGFVEAVVSDCNYTFTEPTGSVDTWSATVDVVTAPCTITAGTCKVSVPVQAGLKSVAITNDTAAGDVTVKANVTGVKYTVTADGFGCPFAGTGEKLNATYVQGAAITFDSTNGSAIDVG
jgi:hypothetical protein